MKNFYIVALTTVFFTSNAFGYSCYFRPYSGNIRVADINGRQIYTLFTTHLSNQPNEYRDILNSGIDIIERTDGFIAEHLDRINSERSDFLQILSLLTSQRINWIGIEANPENMQIVEKKVQDYRRSKEFFNSRGFNQETIDDLIYLLYPFEIKLLAEYPNEIVLDRTDGIRVIPLESDALYEKQSIVGDSRKRIGNEIADDINLTDEQFSTFYNFTLGHLFIDPSDTEEFFTSSGIENIELIEKIRAFVDLENEFNIMNQLRDIFVVRSILDQEGNGIVLEDQHIKNI